MQGKQRIISDSYVDNEIVSSEPAINEIVLTKNNNLNVSSDDYSEFVDITKTAKLQRALKWAGLKPVSDQNIQI